MFAQLIRHWDAAVDLVWLNKVVAPVNTITGECTRAVNTIDSPPHSG